MKILAAIIIFLYGSCSIVIGFALTYRLPERTIQGPNIPYFPIIIGVIIFSLAILCFFKDRLPEQSANRPSRFRWVWLIFSEVILWAGLAFALAPLVAYKNFGYQMPLPGLAFLFWFLFIIIVSIIVYRVSKMNNQTNPDLMRYMALVFFYFNFVNTLFLAFYLIYAPPSKIAYTFWAAIFSLGYLPPSLVVLGIVKDQFTPAPDTTASIGQ